MIEYYKMRDYFIFSFLISVGVSILTGGSMEQMWSLANTLQIIFFYGTLNLYFSTDLKSLLSYMRYSNFDNPATDYITEWIVGGISFAKIPISSNFSDLGFGSVNIIVNSFLKIITILWVFLVALVLGLIYRYYKNSDSRTAKFLRKIDIQIRYETMTRIFIEAMLNLSISSIINLSYGSYHNIQDLISFIVAGIVMVAILIVIVYAFLYPVIYHEEIVKFPDLNERHCLLFLGFRKEKLKCLLFYGIFLIHRLVLSVVFVWMKNFPKHQWVLLLYFCLLMLVYWVRFRPFESQIQNYITWFNGSILTIF